MTGSLSSGKSPERWLRVVVLITAAGVIGGSLWFFALRSGAGDLAGTDAANGTQAVPGEAASQVAKDPAKPDGHVSSVSQDSGMIDQELLNLFYAASQRFAAGGLTPEEAIEQLRMLREAVAALDPTVAANTLISFLESGQDADTGLLFQVGEGGALEMAPSMRVAALDELGLTGSPRAAEYAHLVMDQTNVADEYAVSLRNLAWGSSDLGEVRLRFSEMLDRDPWLSEPSRGFMEAFDIAVATADADMLAEVANVVLHEPGTNPPLNRPAFIALDRIAVRKPGLVADAFAQDPEFLSWAPMQRASILSRMNPGDPQQLAAIESYLLSGNHGPGELEYFLRIFPNVNGLDGNRMVTEEPEIVNIAQVDTAARQVLSTWRNDPRFQHLSPALDRIAERIKAP